MFYDKNMCGRFSFQPTPEILQALAKDQHDLFQTGDVIVPEMDILMYRQNGLDIARWNFKPEWADESWKATTHNARSETVAEKAVFRDAWGKNQRCVIPADYFFEWQHGTKLGFTVHPANEERNYLYFAGLWEQNKYGLRCTILTKASGDNVRQYHRRMPIMLPRTQLKNWLSSGPIDALNIIAAANDKGLRVDPYKSEKKQAALF